MRQVALKAAAGALLLTIGCAGSGKPGGITLDQQLPDSGLADDANTSGDGAPSDRDGTPRDTAITDKDVAADASLAKDSLPPDMQKPPQGLCALPGPANEKPPKSPGGARFIRASEDSVSFCVTDLNTPGQAFGDTKCARLGAEYTWQTIGSYDDAGEAAKAVYDPKTKNAIYLAGPVKGYSGGGFVSQGNSITFNRDTVNVGGRPTYSPDCIPSSSSWTAHLLCAKDAQPALQIDTNAVEKGLVGAYDANKKQYVIAYSSQESVYLARVNAYADAKALPIKVASVGAGEEPKPRLAVSASSKVLLIWQTIESDFRGAYFKHYALYDGDNKQLAGPDKYLPFSCFNSRGQHAVAYDANSDRFLVAANCDGPNGPTVVSLYVQTYDGKATSLRGLLPFHNKIESKYDKAWGFQSTDSLFLSFNPRDKRYLVFDKGERISLDENGTVIKHDRVDRALGSVLALAPDSDLGGFRVLSHGSGGQTAKLDTAGALEGPLQQWHFRSASSRFWSTLSYVSQSSPGNFAGKFIAQSGAVQQFLNSDGSGCYPAVARDYPGEGDEAIVVLNTTTGGFARFFKGKSDGLWMRVYLSNGDAY
jgi:hypothetical protein